MGIITFRRGDPEALVSEFKRANVAGELNFVVDRLEHPEELDERNILAVHYADGGAQGDAGAVKILYNGERGVQILYGNYCYGGLNLDAVIRKLPMLRCLDSRDSYTPPYPFGGKLEIPDGWGYLYMGAMNHFFATEYICRATEDFMQALLQNRSNGYLVFNATAWFCGAL